MNENLRQAVSRSLHTGVTGMVGAWIAGASWKAGFLYFPQFGFVTFVTDLALNMVGLSTKNTNKLTIADFKHLLRTGAVVGVYFAANALSPSVFPLIKQSWKRTILVNSVSVLLGSFLVDTAATLSIQFKEGLELAKENQGADFATLQKLAIEKNKT